MTNTTVTFEGLMVFHKDTQGQYEVGILKGVPDHQFMITVEPDPTTGSGVKLIEGSSYNYQTNYRWSLEVRNLRTKAIRTTDIPTHEGGHDGRLDDMGDQADFSWIIDFESNDFYGGEIEMYPGMLRPILHLTNGVQLYTKCKTDAVNLRRGIIGTEFQSFGYVAEQIALDIDLQEGEECVLRIENTDPEELVFSLPFGSNTTYKVHIENTSVHRMTDQEMRKNQTSHLQFYYLLFPQAPADRFEIRATDALRSPRDRCPQVGTVDPFRCGAVELGTRSRPLS